MLLSDSIRKSLMHIHNKILNKTAETETNFSDIIKEYSSFACILLSTNSFNYHRSSLLQKLDF